MHLGDFQTVGILHRLRIDFRTPNYRDLSGETPQRIPGRDRAGIGEGACHYRARAAKIRIAGDDDIGPPGKRPAQRHEGLATHHHRFAHRHRLEALLVPLQAPRNRAMRADHAVVGHRNDQDDFHQRAPCASAASAGPPIRHTVHSSIRTAPSDL